MKDLLIEAFVVGIITLIVGYTISYLISVLFKNNLPPVCKDWNKNRVMEISLFLTGTVTHLLFDLLGGNKWYCKNGYACKSNLSL